MSPIESFDVLTVKHTRQRRNCFELGADEIEQRWIEHPGAQRGLIRVVREDVPCRESEIVESRQGNEVANARCALLGALAETNRAELRERADRLSNTLTDLLDSGDEGAAYSPQADEQDGQFP